MRFVRITTSLLAVMTALMSMAVLFRRIYPSPNELQIQGFTLCNSRLCFLGVAPGITSAQDAVTILTQHRAIEKPNSLSTYTIGDKRLRLGIFGSAIASIAIDKEPYEALPLAVGDVLSYLGNPCRMTFETDMSGGYMITLIYPYGYLTAVSGQGNCILIPQQDGHFANCYYDKVGIWVGYFSTHPLVQPK